MNNAEIVELIEWLNARTKEYDEGKPTVSDNEWNKAYFILKDWENTYKIYYPNSPTQLISYRVVNVLEKVEHGHEMLSLDKTKSLDEIGNFLGRKPYIVMSKMDGLTCSLRYEDGILVTAETRGNGRVGELITDNARVVKNIPKKIPFKDTLVIDGEIICKINDFEPFANEYKNPRNFAAGSIRLLDNQECAKRNLSFVAWEVIEGLEDIPYLSTKLGEIESFGFTVVPWASCPADTVLSLDDTVNYLVKEAERFYYPTDGLVFKFNDCAYGKSLGTTSHHAKNAIAYKFFDEEYETTLLDIEWQVGRTGQITPIAKFKAVDTGDSVLEKASLHNLSIINEILGVPYKGQPITVVKKNMIIPQVIAATKTSLEEFQEIISIPEFCPVCGKPVSIKNDTDSQFLFCDNPDCEGKFLNKLENFVCKKGLDIKGLSKKTLEKLIDWGWVNSFKDIFNLSQYRNEWVQKDGFGSKSVDKILDAIAASKNCKLEQFLTALGIPLIGASTAKDLAQYFDSWDNFIEAVESNFDFTNLPNFGYETKEALLNFDYTEAKENALLMTFVEPKDESVGRPFEGLTFVITGTVTAFKNRNELKNYIEARGGKVTGSVTKNTSYLVCNNVSSTSSKATSARAIGVPIISEKEIDFLKKI